MVEKIQGLKFSIDPSTGTTDLSEHDLAKVVPPNSGNWESVFTSALINGNMRGVRVLDVGGSASDFTAKLLELGADAYSIDPKYANMSALKGAVIEANNGFRALGFSKAYEDQNKAFKRFKDSSMIHRDRYKTAVATAIPFPDNFFDIVFSRFTIFGYLDIDRSILNSAIQDCLRVTKPGGTVRLYPFRETQMDWEDKINSLRSKNNDLILETLGRDPQVARVEPIVIQSRSAKHETLLIQKR